MVSNNFADEYYNHTWSQIDLHISLQEEARIKETIALIPKNCSSILDVGCGDGRITNRLISTYRHVCGLDSNKEALKHVVAEKETGRLDSLPFTDKSFNLILCCEVLEHLPVQSYSVALKEIERVSEKYIIITVPNNENRRNSSVTCPYCGCVFNASRHVRSFDVENLKNLFGQFSPQIIKPIVFTKTHFDTVCWASRILNPILGFSFPANAMCPQCGYSIITKNGIPSNASKTKRKFSFPRKITKLIPMKRKGIWLAALYERK